MLIFRYDWLHRNSVFSVVPHQRKVPARTWMQIKAVLCCCLSLLQGPPQTRISLGRGGWKCCPVSVFSRLAREPDKEDRWLAVSSSGATFYHRDHKTIDTKTWTVGFYKKWSKLANKRNDICSQRLRVHLSRKAK